MSNISDIIVNDNANNFQKENLLKSNESKHDISINIKISILFGKTLRIDYSYISIAIVETNSSTWLHFLLHSFNSLLAE